MITSFFDGFSDHTIGIAACLHAVSKGAKIIEKHFYFSGTCLSFNGLGMLSQGVDAPENKQLINHITKKKN